MIKKNPHIGSSCEDFLAEEGLLEDCTNAAMKRVVAWQVEQAMQERGLTKAAMAHEMHTSRAALNRLLDPGEYFCHPAYPATCCGGRWQACADHARRCTALALWLPILKN